MAWNAWRPVESQPPPGLAGSMTLTCACAAPAHKAVATAKNFNKLVIFITISSNLSDDHSPCKATAKSKPPPITCQFADRLHGRIRIQHIQIMAKAVVGINDVGRHMFALVSIVILATSPVEL